MTGREGRPDGAETRAAGTETRQRGAETRPRGAETRAGRRIAGSGPRGRSLRARLGRRWVAVATGAAIVVAGGAVAGVAVAAGNGAGRAALSASAPAAGTAASGTPAAGSAASGDRNTAGFQDPAAPAAQSDATPVSVSIPAIGVSSSLEDLHRGAAGELDPPKDWDRAGWFADGIVPGQVGPAVIAGHVDSPTAAAVFFRLDELVPGDEIHVTMSDRTTRTFTVDRSERAAKSAFPTSDVYGTAPTSQLRLITCDGTFDTATGHYTDNLIVFADLSAE